jgi:hypothetical protein
MMKAIFFVALCMLLLTNAAYSSYIEVGINEVMKGSAITITYDNTTNIARFSTEFFNSGSIGYSARAKVEIYDNSTLVFNGWSQQKGLTPGERKTLDVYWYNNETKVYDAKVKVYYGNEIEEYDKFDFSISGIQPKDAFEMTNFRTYDDHVIFDVRSNQDARNIMIIPSQYTYGWIFEQRELGNMSKGESRTVVMNYSPSLWSPGSVTLIAASDVGRLFGERTFEMRKESGLSGLLLSFIDSIRTAFS